MTPLRPVHHSPPLFPFYPAPKRVSSFTVFLGITLCLFLRSGFCEPVQVEKCGLLGLSAGVIDIHENNKAGLLRIEYQSSRRLWKFIPFTGLMVTTGTALYGYGGLGLELCLGPHWMVIPQLGVGLYHQINGRGLGHPLEFFSNLELAYRFKDRSRLGLALGHLSNNGLGSDNPGTESIVLTYTRPLDHLFSLLRGREEAFTEEEPIRPPRSYEVRTK